MAREVLIPGASGLTYAVGDVHGRLDLVERAFDRIAAHAGARPHRMVMLGDYVDRGPESAGVIAFLMRRQAQADVVCLKGNHEDMMLRALAGEDGALRSWLANGGVETLLSYGVRAYGDIERAVLDAHLDWLAALPLIAADPHRIYVHAGLAPDVPLRQQDEATLLWIRGPFLRAPAGAFEAHVVHGHTPLWDEKPEPAEPELLAHRTNLDTGAYFTGVLTVGVFDPAEPGGPTEVLQVSET
ncbi:MAG TPA: metallophosphoesterase family protein [Caulobacteraceae bacterium]|nr:metallophosphoesterase family protein [Caulobacteraceae bacterium]